MSYLKLFFRDLFLISFVSFIIFFLADLAKPGFVTNYLSINAILLLVIFFGIVAILSTREADEEESVIR